MVVTSEAAFATQREMAMEALMMVFESAEYYLTTKGYQKKISAKVVKLAAEGDTARTVRVHEEGAG